MTAKADVMLTVNQVAERLNMNPYTIRELLRNGDLRGFKINDTRWRVKESDLDKFVSKHRKNYYAA